MRPMLAAKVGFAKLEYPCLVSPKIDGIRFLAKGGQLLSRSLKVLPNEYLQYIASDFPDGIDGEITVGDPTGNDVMQRTTSGVMSISGEPEFQFHLFDVWNCKGGYDLRFKVLMHDWVDLNKINPSVKLVQSLPCHGQSGLEQYMAKFLFEGYEGAMVRSPYAHYKFGRSTVNEGALLKYKHFLDDEAIVLGFEELLHNDNEAFEGELGQTKRQSLQENMLGMETLGSLKVYNPNWPKPFNIGTGFDQATRQYIWDRRDQYMGKVVKFRYFATGVKDAPRFPVFLGWRHEVDM